MPQVAARMASRDENTGRYQRHRPEQTLLYQSALDFSTGLPSQLFMQQDRKRYHEHTKHHKRAL